LARRVGAAERAWSWTRRHRAVAALGGVAVLALALSAFAWMHNAAPILPTFKATLQTDPPGAQLHYFPISVETGLPVHARGKKATAGETVNLAPGFHLVVAVLGDGRFHEVFRYVPAALTELYEPRGNHNRFHVIDDVVHLPGIKISASNPDEGMSLVPGTAEFEVGALMQPIPGSVAMPRHKRRIPGFYLDTKEVSVGEYLRATPGFRFPEGKPQPPDNFPMTHLIWDQAVAYAESIGKRLPDEIEYEYVATELGKRRQAPADLVASWTIAVSGQPERDRVEILGQPPIFGLRSNVAEWTGSWAVNFPAEAMIDHNPINRIARGGDFPVINATFDAPMDDWQPWRRIVLARPISYPGLGFRCARSPKPRIHGDSFQEIVSR
jgi:eukaryotic-like serine/threonine-protein kinase